MKAQIGNLKKLREASLNAIPAAYEWIDIIPKTSNGKIQHGF